MLKCILECMLEFLGKKFVEPRRIFIPSKYIMEYLELKDKANALPPGQDNVASLHFWSFVAKVAMEANVDILTGTWYSRGSVLRPYIEEKIDFRLTMSANRADS